MRSNIFLLRIHTFHTIQGNAELFSLSDMEERQRHSLTFQVNRSSQIPCTDISIKMEDLTEDGPEDLEFFIIDTLNGEVVSVIISNLFVYIS